MDSEIQLKTSHSRLSERITLCVEPELKDLYDECMTGAEVAEDVRRYMRARLQQIKGLIEASRDHQATA